jgi:hypothetical protein
MHVEETYEDPEPTLTATVLLLACYHDRQRQYLRGYVKTGELLLEFK